MGAAQTERQNLRVQIKLDALSPGASTPYMAAAQMEKWLPWDQIMLDVVKWK
jgi:hypothetical protein